MRVGEHDARAGRAQYGDGFDKRRPFFGNVAGRTAGQPKFESLRDIACVSGIDERAGEVHASRNFGSREDAVHQRSRGDRCLALEALADFDQTRGASHSNLREMRRESRMSDIKIEPDDVQSLAIPSARHFNTRNVTYAVSSTGETCRLATGNGVVVGQCSQTHAPRGAELDERLGCQQAIGMMAVQMQIGDGRGGHRRYDSPMSLLPGQSPRWDEIDTVLLDLDGTLLDLAFDNYIWLARVAEIYAENNGLSLAETHAELAPRFKRVQGTLDWYSIDYWSAQLGIDIERVHRDEAHRVAWLPGARRFLEQVRERGKRLVLMTNSHPVILGIKAERTGVLRYLDAAYTSHGFGAPKEDQKFWIAARQAEPYDPARTMFVDDSKAVLYAAIEAGVRWVYGVKRPDTSREPHNHEEFSAIDGVDALL